MAKVSSFVGKMPDALTLHNYMMVCCSRFIPFHYDPATKVFSAYPVCQEDLDEMQDFYRYVQNRDLNPLPNGMFNSNLNR